MLTSADPAQVFYAYSHKDEMLRDELGKQLSILRRQKVVADWHDRRIGAGTEWKGEIDKYLNSSRVILLLVSSDFLASDYCYDVEMQRALERHRAGEARVIPVILRPCLWKHPPLDNLQALPRDAKPVTTWLDRDEAFLNVAEGIREAVQVLTAAPPNGNLWRSLVHPTAEPEVGVAPQLPLAPHIFTGTVTFSGRRFVTAPAVTAWIDDSPVPGASAVWLGQRYSLVVAQPTGRSFAGKTIHFTVGNTPAKETAVWRAGEATVLNLTVQRRSP
jgi:TIR domain